MCHVRPTFTYNVTVTKPQKKKKNSFHLNLLRFFNYCTHSFPIIPGKGCHAEECLLLPSHAISCCYCSLHFSLSAGIQQLRKQTVQKTYILHMLQLKTMAPSTMTYWLTLVKVLYLYRVRSQLKLKAKQLSHIYCPTKSAAWRISSFLESEKSP